MEYNGDDVSSRILDYEGINEYNSIRWWVDGKEVLAKDIEMIIYNDEEQNDANI